MQPCYVRLPRAAPNNNCDNVAWSNSKEKNHPPPEAYCNRQDRSGIAPKSEYWGIRYLEHHFEPCLTLSQPQTRQSHSKPTYIYIYTRVHSGWRNLLQTCGVNPRTSLKKVGDQHHMNYNSLWNKESNRPTPIPHSTRHPREAETDWLQRITDVI